MSQHQDPSLRPTMELPAARPPAHVLSPRLPENASGVFSESPYPPEAQMQCDVTDAGRSAIAEAMSYLFPPETPAGGDEKKKGTAAKYVPVPPCKERVQLLVDLVAALVFPRHIMPPPLLSCEPEECEGPSILNRTEASTTDDAPDGGVTGNCEFVRSPEASDPERLGASSVAWKSAGSDNASDIRTTGTNSTQAFATTTPQRPEAPTVPVRTSLPCAGKSPQKNGSGSTSCRQLGRHFEMLTAETATQVGVRLHAVLADQLYAAFAAEEVEEEKLEDPESDADPADHLARVVGTCGGGGADLGFQCGRVTKDNVVVGPCCSKAATKRHRNRAALANKIVLPFIRDCLPEIRRLLRLDVEVALLRDVATKSESEVVMCYPGVKCLLYQRAAHALHSLGAPPTLTRMITTLAHSHTAIDIHPATRIGESCFIDHGAGIVIGGTAILGDRVSIYQGVTLGARSFPIDPKSGQRIKFAPRHPVVGDDVTIYANATVLGRVSIGAGATIGGNVWVTKNVAPGEAVVQQRPQVQPASTSLFSEGAGI